MEVEALELLAQTGWRGWDGYCVHLAVCVQQGLDFPRQLSDLLSLPGSSAKAAIGLEWADLGLYLGL